MTQPFFVFVPAEHLDENRMEYSAVVDWALTHFDHPNVLVLTEEDVYRLQYQSTVFDIVNEENDSMLGWGENDWVTDRVKLERLQHRLEQYSQELGPGRVQQITQAVRGLAATALRTNKCLYFNF